MVENLLGGAGSEFHPFGKPSSLSDRALLKQRGVGYDVHELASALRCNVEDAEGMAQEAIKKLAFYFRTKDMGTPQADIVLRVIQREGKGRDVMEYWERNHKEETEAEFIAEGSSDMK